MVTWKEFFDQKVDADNSAITGTIQNPGRIITSALVLVGHIVGFIGISILLFRKKDVLS